MGSSISLRHNAPVQRALAVFLALILAITGASVGAFVPLAAQADPASPQTTKLYVTTNPLPVGSDLKVKVTIQNLGDTDLTGLSLRIGVGRQILKNSEALTKWTNQDILPTTYLGPTAYIAPTDPVPAGQTVTRDITIQSRFLGLEGIADQSGILPIGVKLSSNYSMFAAATAGIRWNTQTPAQASMVVPISGILTDNALYSSSELADMTSPSGTLSAQLNAVADAPVTLLADPKVINSIQILGDSAPPSALNWLDRMRQHGNLVSDVWGGADAVALAARKRAQINSSLAGDFEWQTTNWLVPATGRYNNSVFAYAKRAGFSTVVVQDTDATAAANPEINNTQVAVSLTSANSAVAAYLAATIPDDVAIQQLTNSIAAGAQPYTGRPVVLVPATWKNSPQRLSDLIKASTDPASGISLQPTLQKASGVVTKVRLVGQAKNLFSLKRVRQLLDVQQKVAEFSYVAVPASTINLPNVRRVGSLLNPLWANQPDAWDAARKLYLSDSEALRNSVQITNHGSLTLVARTSQVPVMVKNSGNSDITATVRIQPTNGRVVARKQVKVVVGPGKTVTAKVPITAVANGNVNLRVQLLTSKNKAVGQPVVRKMTVRSQLETWTFLALAAAVVGLFVFGLIRGFRRNRKAAKRESIDGK